MVHRAPRLSDAGASVDKVHNPVGFIEVSINAAIFNLSLRPSVFCRQRKVRVFARAYLEMPIRPALESEHVTFEPDTIAVLAIALEDTLRQLRLVDGNDPAVTMIAKRIIELARRGERDPIRLRDQAIQSFR
jgi:hypothetical protein